MKTCDVGFLGSRSGTRTAYLAKGRQPVIPVKAASSAAGVRVSKIGKHVLADLGCIDQGTDAGPLAETSVQRTTNSSRVIGVSLRP